MRAPPTRTKAEAVATISIELLRGCYVAASTYSRRSFEWPPHPGRLFAAMVAEWGALPESQRDTAERDALCWLECQPAPQIAASPDHRQRVVRHWVPLNDNMAVNRGKGVHRLKKHNERWFPTVIPRTSRVSFIWPDLDVPDAHLNPLRSVLGRVTQLGHSSSLVSCYLRSEADDVDDVWLTPTDSRLGHQIRWVTPGQVDLLEREHAQRQEEMAKHGGGMPPRDMHLRSCCYTESRSVSAPVGVLRPDTAGKMIVFEMSSRPPASAARDVAKAFRNALMSHTGATTPLVLSGHDPDGARTQQPHALFAALPDVGHEHASGNILGIAMLLPDSLDNAARSDAERAVLAWERHVGGADREDVPELHLNMSGGTSYGIRRLASRADLVGLRQETWSKTSRHWVSVTPVVLFRHPGPLTAAKRGPQARAKAWQRAEEIVTTACEHVGLPRPASVNVSFTPMLPGAHDGHRFRPFRDGARRLIHLHASLTFDEPVGGPLLLGHGRYQSMGLMRPVFAATAEGKR